MGERICPNQIIASQNDTLAAIAKKCDIGVDQILDQNAHLIDQYSGEGGIKIQNKFLSANDIVIIYPDDSLRLIFKLDDVREPNWPKPSVQVATYSNDYKDSLKNTEWPQKIADVRDPFVNSE